MHILCWLFSSYTFPDSRDLFKSSAAGSTTSCVSSRSSAGRLSSPPTWVHYFAWLMVSTSISFSTFPLLSCFCFIFSITILFENWSKALRNIASHPHLSHWNQKVQNFITMSKNLFKIILRISVPNTAS